MKEIMDQDTKEVIAGLCQKVAALQKFKDFVHTRLDDYGVPSDPDPEGTKAHGCRISGRLKWLNDEVERQRSLTNHLRCV